MSPFTLLPLHLSLLEISKIVATLDSAIVKLTPPNVFTIVFFKGLLLQSSLKYMSLDTVYILVQ